MEELKEDFLKIYQEATDLIVLVNRELERKKIKAERNLISQEECGDISFVRDHLKEAMVYLAGLALDPKAYEKIDSTVKNLKNQE